MCLLSFSSIREGRSRQRGISLILFTAGMLAIIAITGLALDIGMVYLTKTRLQNALDAAALDGAKTLNDTHSAAQGSSAALASFTANIGTIGAGITPVVETSATLSPFTVGSANPRYLRVRVAALPASIRLAIVVPGVSNTLNVPGSAVAGPLPLGGNVCGAFPVMMCAQATDTDCSDYSCYGISGGPHTEVQLTYAKKKIGPGNYGFVELGGCTGSCLRDEMAGGVDFCFTPGGKVTTEPGLNTGPVQQGFNTRFGIYSGPVSSSQYPPDVVTTNSPVIYYDAYLTRLADKNSWNFPNGVPQRRVVLVPMVDCGSGINGRTDVPVIGSACFFLTRPLTASDTIFGQLLPTCNASGSGPPPTGGPAVGYKIVLFQDPDHPRGS